MLADIIVIAILVVIVALVIRTMWTGLQPLQGLSLIHGMVCMNTGWAFHGKNSSAA